jgi:hypothetical protein
LRPGSPDGTGRKRWSLESGDLLGDQWDIGGYSWIMLDHTLSMLKLNPGFLSSSFHRPWSHIVEWTMLIVTGVSETGVNHHFTAMLHGEYHD